MIKIYKKKLKKQDFYYLTEQIWIGDKYKKIQVYLGKNIPKDLSLFYGKLRVKEEELILSNLKKIFKLDKKLDWEQVEKVEKNKIIQKYFFAQLSEKEKKDFFKKFAIEFIFHSNAIEGSRLSKEEVEKIVKNKYLKNNLDKKEIIEVKNSIKAFDFILNDFKLNQKNIKLLHKILTEDLGIDQGYKKKEVVVNNKQTIWSDCVKKSLQELILNFLKKNKKEHQFFKALNFHSSFELIHPFADGNGRVGRMILIWMLLQENYGIILFELKNRQKYFKSLDKADDGMYQKFYWYSVQAYNDTTKRMDDWL